MDINNIQALIAQGLLTDVASVDPNKAYVAVGVFQPGNRQSGPAGNAYPSYAMPISEFLAAGGVYTASNGIALVGNDFQLASQNISQFINDAGYITSVTPQDLQSVVTAGNVLTSFNLVQSPDGNNKIDIDNNNLRLRRFVPGLKFSYVLVNNTNVEITNLDFASGKTGSLTVDPLGGNILDNSVKNTFTAPVHLFNTGNVGIAVTPTDTRLHVKGNSTPGDFTFKAEDAGGNPLLYVRNDGAVSIGTTTALSIFTVASPFNNISGFVSFLSAGDIFVDAISQSGYVLKVNTVVKASFSTNSTNASIIVPSGGLSIGTTSFVSSAMAHVLGDATSSNYALKVDNSAPSPLLYVRNDGLISAPLLPTSNTGLTTGDMYVATAADILSNGDKVVGWKV